MEIRQQILVVKYIAAKQDFEVSLFLEKKEAKKKVIRLKWKEHYKGRITGYHRPQVLSNKAGGLFKWAWYCNRITLCHDNKKIILLTYSQPISSYGWN